MTLQDDVLQYQSIATNNWPAKDLILMNGWILRVSEGITRRANSVLPLRYKGTNLDDDIDNVEKIYTDSKLPTVFQISDYYAPENLHEKLLERKYKTIAESFYMSAPATILSFRSFCFLLSSKVLNSFILYDIL